MAPVPRSHLLAVGLGIAATFSCGRIGFDELSLGDAGESNIDGGGQAASEWLRQIASADTRFTRLGSDADGNVTVTSSFEGTVVVEGGDSKEALGVDTVLLSYDPGGQLRWNRFFSSSVLVQFYDVAVDANGHTHGVGLASGTVTISDRIIMAGNRQDVLVAHVDNDGEVVTAEIYEGGSANAQGRAIGIDQAGNSMIAGVYGDSINFGGGPLESNGIDNGFVASLDATGAHLWSREFVSAPVTITTAVDIDESGVSCVGGFFEGPIDDFGDGQTYDVVSGNDAGDAFVAQYDPDGNLLGLAIFGSEGADRIPSVKRVSGGCIVAARICGDSAQVPISYGACDGVLARIATDGTQEWVVSMGAEEREEVTDIAVGASGTIYLGGWFTHELLFGPLSLSRVDDNTSGAFFAAVDANGKPLWLQELVGTDARIASVAVSADESVLFAAGRFQGALEHAGRTIDAAGSRHGFLASIATP